MPEALVRLGLWVAAEYVSTPARGLALVLPPGTGTGAARPLRPRRSLRAALTDEGRAAWRTAAERNPAQAAEPPARGATRSPPGRLAGSDRVAVARLAGADHSTLRSLERRGLVQLEQATEAPRRPRIEGVGARGGVEPTAAQRAALERSWSASTRRRGSRCCSTA